MSTQGNWFQMSKGDRFALLAILLLVAFGFVLFKFPSTILGISTFGWFMGLMMFIAPLLSLAGMCMDKNTSDKTTEGGCAR